MTPPLVSVLVPVRNGGRDLPGLLECLERQTLGRERFEILIGDDGSTDGATDGLETADGHLKVMAGPPINSYAARNRIAHAARGEVLAFTDADCRPAPDWLERGLQALEEADVVAGLIRHHVAERLTIWSLVDMDAFLDQERAVRAGVAVTANLFLRRELYERVPDFDESADAFGDHDFVGACVAAGARLAFSPDAVVGHPTRDDGRVFLRKFWNMHEGYGARERRLGRRPEGLKPVALLPIVGVARARRWFGRSLGLDRRRLSGNGIRPTLPQRLAALPILYVLLPYMAAAAQWRGYRAARAGR
jgi:glycosyltransferase involved in cell wall biosynthesis